MEHRSHWRDVPYAFSVGFIPNADIEMFKKEGYEADMMPWGYLTVEVITIRMFRAPWDFKEPREVQRYNEMIELRRREISNGTTFGPVRPMNHFNGPSFNNGQAIISNELHMSLRTPTLLPKAVGFSPNRASGPSKLNPEAPVFTLSNQTATVHQTSLYRNRPII